MKEITYDVFARKDRGDLLSHIGYVDAFDDETAKVHAWTTYSEVSWFEMCVVRRSAILSVTPESGTFATRRKNDDE